MPHEPHEDPAALLAELREGIESAAAEITQLTSELARRDGCIDELESALDTVLGLVEQSIVVVDVDQRIRALSRGAAQRFGRHAGVGKPLSASVPEDVFAAVQAQPRPPDDAETGSADTPPGSGGTSVADTNVEAAAAAVVPLPGEGAIVVLNNGVEGRRDSAPGPAQGRPPGRRARGGVSSERQKEQGRRGRRSR